MQEGLDLPEVSLVLILMRIKKDFCVVKASLVNHWPWRAMPQEALAFVGDSITGSMKRHQ